jgi:hypothetical protein
MFDKDSNKLSLIYERDISKIPSFEIEEIQKDINEFMVKYRKGEIEGDNEYYAIFLNCSKKYPTSFLGHYYRDILTRQYSFAIPNQEAISSLVNLSHNYPIVELGAGTGYWASLIAQKGGKIECYDPHPPLVSGSKNMYSFTHSYYKVNNGDENILNSDHIKQYNNKYTLFLCWPSYNKNWAAHALNIYQGPYVVYIGEDRGGCTADDKFFDMLDFKFTEENIINIPQWMGMNDRMYIYKRN